jgi:hypothetical protein
LRLFHKRIDPSVVVSLEERCHPHQEGREHGGQRASNPCWRERRSYHNLNLPYLVY